MGKGLGDVLWRERLVKAWGARVCSVILEGSWRFLKVPTPTPPGPSIHLQTSAPLRPGAGATNDDHQDICCVRTHFSHFFSFLFFVIDCHVQYLASQRCGKGKDECVSVCDYWNLGDDYWPSRIPWLWEQPDCHIRQSQPMLQQFRLPTELLLVGWEIRAQIVELMEVVANARRWSGESTHWVMPSGFWPYF